MNTKFTALLALFLFGLCMSQENNLRMTLSDDFQDPDIINRSVDQMIQSYQSSNQGICFAKSLNSCRYKSIQCAIEFISFQACKKDECKIEDEKNLDLPSYYNCINDFCYRFLQTTLRENINQIYYCLDNLTEEELQNIVNVDNDEQDDKEDNGEEQPNQPINNGQQEDKEDQELENVVNSDNNKNTFSSLISLILLGINLILF
ncbi:hypothetical protein ABPG74_002028 [Tetrahymena malaccensis]